LNFHMVPHIVLINIGDHTPQRLMFATPA